MKLRVGFVAMSVNLKNATPSSTMTVTNFNKIIDREAGLRKLTNIAAKNLQNTLRILRHAHAHDIHLYRFTSKLIPMLGHELTEGWNFWSKLGPEFEEVGKFVRDTGMRVSFHPDHYTILNSKSDEVVANSILDMERHVKMFELMGLDERAKLVMHVGGSFKDKADSLQRFEENWASVPDHVKRRVTLENDDKTYTALETLELCERLGIPMVLDIHHHRCNPGDEELRDLVPRVFATWEPTGLVPKIHVSSPKSEEDPRHHADYIDIQDLVPFLDLVHEIDNQDFDIMVEAKQKDDSAFRLAADLAQVEGMKKIDGGTFEYK
ncbi:UV DNA damage repair endonuclease UvsE [Tumebacillus sp. ITR2]|uniref:UV DNA damage repair endonuclease UvsE n=1 Tax=Tumebacillus amylolyticus TaxID=2801339 RepID=A0ABS1JDN5_9BACL|nr:UV DNA damage repair endonuclease UvsE [Tumebacillus amylolyticus]MBL0388403.1 UV DNA damage repair endonuclease UvsE [Tumebacillus amylolyticus]